MNRSPRAAEHLTALDRAVTKTYRDFLTPHSPWRASFFSDTLVLAAPVDEFGGDQFAVGGLVTQAALLQFDFVLQGFFVRGGLSLGDFHIDDGLIFGPALVRAHELESKISVHPRVVLDEPAGDAKQQFLLTPADDEAVLAPLMRDGDGRVFVDYLGLQLDEPDADLAFSHHRDMLVEKLREHRRDKTIWEKYRWVAEYHNARIALAGEAFGPETNVEALLVPAADHRWGFERFAA